MAENNNPLSLLKPRVSLSQVCDTMTVELDWKRDTSFQDELILNMGDLSCHLHFQDKVMLSSSWNME